MLKQIIEAYPDETFYKADGFDDAIIGVVDNGDAHTLVYSIKKCIEILMKDMPEEDAAEYFYYNVAGSSIGENTPVWCDDNF